MPPPPAPASPLTSGGPSSSPSGRRCCRRGPIDEVSVDDIAAAAGISRGLLFHYFATKRDFHVAVATAAAEEMLSTCRPPTRPPTGSTSCGRAWPRSIDYVDSHRAPYLSLVRGRHERRSGHAGALRVDPGPGDGPCARGLRLPARRPSTDPLAVRGWVGFVEDTVTTWLQGDGIGIERDALLELLERSLLALIRSALDVA